MLVPLHLFMCSLLASFIKLFLMSIFYVFSKWNPIASVIQTSDSAWEVSSAHWIARLAAIASHCSEESSFWIALQFQIPVLQSHPDTG